MGVSIKLCYRPSAIKGKDGTLYYQIIIKRTTHTDASGYRNMPLPNNILTKERL